jgi:hypothetical protein
MFIPSSSLREYQRPRSIPPPLWKLYRDDYASTSGLSKHKFVACRTVRIGTAYTFSVTTIDVTIHDETNQETHEWDPFRSVRDNIRSTIFASSSLEFFNL